MDCWLITPRGEVMPLEFDHEPPEELCLPDRPVSEMVESAEEHLIQPAVYITYKRYHLAAESGRLGTVYGVRAPTVGDMQLLSAYRSGLEARLRLT